MLPVFCHTSRSLFTSIFLSCSISATICSRTFPYSRSMSNFLRSSVFGSRFFILFLLRFLFQPFFSAWVVGRWVMLHPPVTCLPYYTHAAFKSTTSQTPAVQANSRPPDVVSSFSNSCSIDQSTFFGILAAHSL